MILNFGNASAIKSAITMPITTIASTIIQLIARLVCETMMMPPIAIMAQRNYAQKHHKHHLDLLNIICSTRNKRRCRKGLHFSIRKGNNLFKETFAKITRNFCCGTRCHKTYRNRSGHHSGRQHPASERLTKPDTETHRPRSIPAPLMASLPLR